MLGRQLVRIAPRTVWKYRIRRWGIVPGDGEPEARLLPSLVNQRKTSVDIGAAMGMYTAPLVALSRSVVAFEPVPDVAASLRAMFSDTSVVRVENVALSDHSGTAEVRKPRDSFFRTTLETVNPLRYSTDIETLTVQVRTLDEYDLRGVGFVKIDVEGHELAVLRGARDTLRRERPNVLIEVEEQHREGATRDVFDFFDAMGYRGAFLLDGAVRPVDAFEQTVHQNVANLDRSGKRAGLYVNNFFFTPR